MPLPQHCPLCGGQAIHSYGQDQRRDYWCCERCSLVFVDSSQHLSCEEEKAVYDLHQNDVQDTGYRRFLERLFNPVKAHLSPDAKGLDFGCGPGPALAQMFQESGFEMSVYDKFYQTDSGVLNQRYDFITATEVIEHLSHPGKELDQLWSLLKPGGLLGVMTKRVIDQAAFAKWHYKNDLTHISFFADKTMHWLGEHWQAEILVMAKDVVVFKKSVADS